MENSTIHALPPELLRKIFQLASPSGRFDESKAISFTCRQWRAVSLDTRELWTTIQVPIAPSANSNTDAAHKYWTEMKARTKDSVVNILISDASGYLIGQSQDFEWNPDPIGVTKLFSIHPDIYKLSINFKPASKDLYIFAILRSITVPYTHLCLQTEPGHPWSYSLRSLYSFSPLFTSLELLNVRAHGRSVDEQFPLEKLRIRYSPKSRTTFEYDHFMSSCPNLHTLDVEFKSRRPHEYATAFGPPPRLQRLENLVVEYSCTPVIGFNPLLTPVLSPLTTLILRTPFLQKEKLITFLEYHPTITTCGLALDTHRGSHPQRLKQPKYITLGETAQACPQLTSLHIFPPFTYGTMSTLLLDAFSESRKGDWSCLSFFPALISLRVQFSRSLSLRTFDSLVEACYPTALPKSGLGCSASKLRNFSVIFSPITTSNADYDWSTSKYLEKAEMYSSTKPTACGWDISWPQ